jgi:hypothetical protein
LPLSLQLVHGHNVATICHLIQNDLDASIPEPILNQGNVFGATVIALVGVVRLSDHLPDDILRDVAPQHPALRMIAEREGGFEIRSRGSLPAARTRG